MFIRMVQSLLNNCQPRVDNVIHITCIFFEQTFWMPELPEAILFAMIANKGKGLQLQCIHTPQRKKKMVKQ